MNMIEGINHKKHAGMVATRVHQLWLEASPETLEQCASISQEERNALGNDDIIYHNQATVGGFLSEVAKSLYDAGEGRIGNMIFHGIGAYRDKNEVLHFFNVDVTGDEVAVLSLSASNRFIRHSTMNSKFMPPTMLNVANQKKQPATSASLTLAEFNPEEITPLALRGILADFIRANWENVFGDPNVQWDKIRENPTLELS
ncbi:hypothetical protein PM082_024857 [Marasmius tenuissimus]|nr:hypothetical protein PM082_024857 [Marasmius tenuissimus]